MTSILTALKVLLIIFAYVFSVAVLNELPGWWPYLELWLLPVFLLSYERPRLALWLALSLGWLANGYYASANGLPVLLLPLVAAILVFVHANWKTHRPMLRVVGTLLLGTFLYHFLGLAYEFIASVILGSELLPARALDVVSSIPKFLLMNLAGGILLQSFVRKVFQDEEPSHYGSRSPIFS